jgi:putative ABC transport system permease protein
MLEILAGALALGLLWAVVTTGIFVSYRVLDVADLSVEGSIVTGAATAAVLLTREFNPYLALLAASLAGAAAGLVTGLLHTKLRIPALLSGILCMIALYSVNIRIMGNTSNLSLLRTDTLLTPLLDAGFSKNNAAIIVGLVAVTGVVALLCWFLQTEFGSALRATGNNPHMSTAQGINIDTARVVGLALSNALVGLAGGLLVQYQGFADVQMGVGAIVIGLASLIIGEVIFGRHSLLRSLIAVALGAVVYRIIIALVLEAGMAATDLKLFTALTVALALWLPTAKGQLAALSKRWRGRRLANSASSAAASGVAPLVPSAPPAPSAPKRPSSAAESPAGTPANKGGSDAGA